MLHPVAVEQRLVSMWKSLWDLDARPGKSNTYNAIVACLFRFGQQVIGILNSSGVRSTPVYDRHTLISLEENHDRQIQTDFG